ncbi:MAG: MerR family DNA-binding transcriptional regulator, partial [Patescibacteria group bacterium]
MPKNLSNIRIQEAADFVGVSSKTLRRWEKKGKLVPERSVGNQRYYSKEVLDKFVNSKNLFSITPPVNVNKPFNILKWFAVPAVIAGLAVFAGILNTSEESIRPPSEEFRLDSSEMDGSVLATSTGLSGSVGQTYTFSVNVPALFNDKVTFKKSITAPNLVTSVNDETGDIDLVLTAGSGITVDGLTVTNADRGSSVNVFKTLSISGQSDVVADGNTDTLTFVASGGITLTTDATNDKITINSASPDYTLSGFTDGGTSVYLSTSTDSLGIGTSSPSYKLHTVGTGYFSDTLTAGGALAVTGATTLNGAVTLGDAATDSITFTGRVANGTSLLPNTDLGSDLGSSALRFNNLWVANINSNSSQSFSGQTTFSYAPTDTTISQASVLINPTTAAANGQLLAFGVAGYQRAAIDEDGDIILGYNSLTSAPATDYPLTIYGHSGTNVAYIDTAGLGNFQTVNLTTGNAFTINNSSVLNATTLGTGVTTSSLTTTGALSSGSIATGFGTISTGNTITTTGTMGTASTTSFTGNGLTISSITTPSGALSISPASGSNLNVSLATTGDFVVNTNDLVVDTSSGYIGINTTAPTALLDLAGTSGTDAFRLTNSGSKVLGLKYETNAVTFDQTSTDPTNKLSNGTFDSDLTSWSEVPSYTLNDQFTTDRAAGAVNGTSAEPTGGTRTVVDTESKLSIASSALTFAGGKTTPAFADPMLYYSAVSRTAGLTFVSKVNASTLTSHYFRLGFDDGLTGDLLHGIGNSFSSLGVMKDGTEVLVGALSTATDYYLATVLRSTGAYYYIKGGVYTNWTLLGSWGTNSTATLYPEIDNYNTAFTVDNIRIPTSIWLPTPLAYDTFTRGDGAIGSSETTGPDSQTTPSLAWTGGAISTNKNVITPSLGSELNGDTGFDNNAYWEKGTGVTVSGSKLNFTSVTATGAYATPPLTTNTWYTASFDIESKSSGGNFYVYPFTPYKYFNTVATGNVISGRPANGNMGIYADSSNTTGVVDNFSVKPLTLSSLFSSVSTSDTDVIADANVTLTAGTQAGLVLNLDSTSTPANFLIAYHDGANVKLDKNVGGTYTNLISAAATYSAGATLRVITYTSAGALKVRVYYNNALVGNEQTVSDAGIISNTKHGLFSTYSGNSFDNFTLFARGTGAEYTGAPFEELTATRDTTTKYAGAASAKLVTAGTDANYLQSVNVGDTSTYNLIAYAYTTGAAVTTADVELYYDTAVLSTTFTPMGATGWYKLTGS